MSKNKLSIKYNLFMIYTVNKIVKEFDMKSWNYSNARAQLSTLMDQAIAGFPVEITRQGRESAIMISKSSYEAYKKAQFDVLYPKNRDNQQDQSN